MKLVKTTTHTDTVVLTDREFDLLHEPDSQLTVIISEKVGDQWKTIRRIETVDLAYALTHVKTVGFAYYEGKKIVFFRPAQQKTRKARAKKLQCKRGHDTSAPDSRHPVSGACKQCQPLHTNVSNQKKRLATARKKLVVAVELQGLNDDTPNA